ncbi:DedA family protein [Collimonas antrihumi]|uniref:DedA family protein n=1 Tax=Collimonas antrihumi TaxID=1940615 RepID=UPI001B8B6D76|nr:DedA family protein [Collimonas antrihumi]
MDIAGLIQNYGYLAVAVGTFLEGETILFMAGVAAYRGHLVLPTVMVVGTLASFLGDQLYFYVGRRYGTALLERFPFVQSRAARAKALLDRHHLPLILSIRFLYGLRIAGPIAIGMSGVPWFRFLVLNLMGAVVWAIVIAGAGYGFGQALAYLLGGFDADEAWLLAAILLSGLLWWLFARRRPPASLGK